MSERDIATLRSVLAGPPSALADDIIACEAALRQAQLDADVATLAGLIAEQLLFAGPDGQLATKAQDLDAHRSGSVRFREHQPEELHVRAVGANVAVVSLRARLRVEVRGVMHGGTFRYTRVWARESGRAWQVVAGHVSEVPAAR